MAIEKQNKESAWEDQFLKQYENAVKRGEEKAKNELTAKRVSYSPITGLLNLVLSNGVHFSIPTLSIPELRGASKTLINKAQLSPRGDAVFWDELDVHYTVSGLCFGAFPASAWANHLGKIGGSATSAKKKQASRLNGTLGGRPKTQIVRRDSSTGAFARASKSPALKRHSKTTARTTTGRKTK